MDSKDWEPGAASPEDRLVALDWAKSSGIKTWASFEPVIDPEQTLNLIRQAMPYLDEIKIGKWNHDKRANEIAWPKFVYQAAIILQGFKGKILFKKDLLAAAPDVEVPNDWR